MINVLSSRRPWLGLRMKNSEGSWGADLDFMRPESDLSGPKCAFTIRFESRTQRTAVRRLIQADMKKDVRKR